MQKCTMQAAAPRAKSRGFSLTELMVATVIGLIGVIVIFQLYSNFEGLKRTTTGAGDAQTNGLLALFTIERDARQAGFGINYAALLGCNVVFTDNGPPQRLNQNFTMAAASIADGAAGAPDTITFVYGDSNMLSGSVPLNSSPTAGMTFFQIANIYGINQGDLLIVGQTPAGGNCSLVQNTSTFAQLPVVNFNNPALPNGRYIPNGGLPLAYTIWDPASQLGGQVLDLGQPNAAGFTGPVVGTYSIDPVKFQLQFQNLLLSAAQTPIVDGIVQLQAQYGKDTINTPPATVNVWDNVTPATPATWAQVLALRIAVVARSSTPEKPNQTTGLCTTTTVAPSWANGTIPIVMTGIPNWQCYRYRVFETIVPLRNQIWIP